MPIWYQFYIKDDGDINVITDLTKCNFKELLISFYNFIVFNKISGNIDNPKMVKAIKDLIK